MTEYLDFIVKDLVATGVDSPLLEAKLLMAEVLHKPLQEINKDTALSETEFNEIKNCLKQRKEHKPLDKILGHRGFFKFDYLVNTDVLTPRPDSEILVEEALQLLAEDETGKILDLGTGSGCLIESILSERPLMQGVAVDISEKALETAEQNANILGLDKRICFLRGDWFSENFADNFSEKFDIVVSNPPYIPTKDIENLAPEVRNYDPLSALDGGEDGYASYRRIAEIAPLIIKDGGYILLEAGYGQATEIMKIFADSGLFWLKTVKDLSGTERCVIMQKAVAQSKKI